MTDNPELAEMRPSQFAKMYEPYQQKNTGEKKDKDVDKIPDKNMIMLRIIMMRAEHEQ